MIKTLGIYIHIPFCNFCCHYCDFAKTALFDKDLTKRYFHKLNQDLLSWIELYVAGNYLIDSINIGGGTPGLFGEEYAPLLATMEPYLHENCEISIEANPQNINVQSLEIWQKLGFNRLSIGIQSFSDRGLKFLTRDHDAVCGAKAVTLALKFFPNTNLDLIYGWSGQTLSEFSYDLDKIVELQVPHVSLYNLTYNKSTPIGKRENRGLIHKAPEELEEKMYELARVFLDDHGYDHEEVSNWSKKGFSCHHNWKYWLQDPYIGIGVSASGYLWDPTIGLRYSMPGSFKKYMEHQELFDSEGGLSLTFEARDREDWLLEFIGCGLRHRRGVDLSRIERTIEQSWSVTPMIEKGLSDGHLRLSNGSLILDKAEWFRETSWSLIVIEGFSK